MIDHRLPHRFLFVFGLLFGGSLVFLSPPYSVPDELAHFHRAYHCSQGKLYACKHDAFTGDDLPSSLTETYLAIAGQAGYDDEFYTSETKMRCAASIALEPQRVQFTVFSNTALYSPVPYLPQTVAIAIGRLCHASPLTLLYCGRMANLLAYLLMAAAAVRLTPIHKWTLALVAMVPMSVYLAASLSADAVTLGLSMLVIALCLHLSASADRPSRDSLLAQHLATLAPNAAAATKPPSARSLWTLGTLLVLLALSKQAYLGLALLFFMIPGENFSRPRQRWLLAGLMIGVPLAIDIVWTYSLRNLYVPMLSFVDPQAQFRWIIDHPWSYAAVVGKAISHPDDYTLMIGVFGWLGPHLPRWIRDTYWVALVLTAVLDGGRPLKLGVGAKAVAFGTYVFTAVVMATFVYLSWEQVGIKSIGGIQPRYFLPILPLLLLLPRGTARLASSRFAQIVVPGVAMTVAIFAAGSTWWTLLKRYY